MSVSPFTLPTKAQLGPLFGPPKPIEALLIPAGVALLRLLVVLVLVVVVAVAGRLGLDLAGALLPGNVGQLSGEVAEESARPAALRRGLPLGGDLGRRRRAQLVRDPLQALTVEVLLQVDSHAVSEGKMKIFTNFV